MNGGKITNCNITGDNVPVDPSENGYGDFVGGVTGQMLGTSSIQGGSFKATVRGRNWTGGIAGSVDATSSIYYVRFFGEVVGDTRGGNNIGGIAGLNEGTITDARNTANVTGSGNDVGGIAGLNEGTITDAHNTANVTGYGENVGGIVGSNNSDDTYHGSITNSSSSSNIIGQNNNVGGIAGYNNGDIMACKAFGQQIKGRGNVGGLAGKMEKHGGNVHRPELRPSSLVDSYYLNLEGRIEATTGYVGGIVGELGNNYKVPQTSYPPDVIETSTIKGCFSWVKELVYQDAYPYGIAGTIAGHVLLSIGTDYDNVANLYEVFCRDFRYIGMSAWGDTSGWPISDFIPTQKFFKDEWPRASTAYNRNNWKHFGDASRYDEDNPPLDCFPKLVWE
jgi:hypothetical protein